MAETMPADVTSLSAALLRMLPAACGAAVALIEGAPVAWPEEEVSILNANPGRRSEFRAGRAAARRAMTDIGHASAAIRKGTGGQPVFPHGLTGSIAHAEGVAVAVAGPVWAISAAGVDIESAKPLEPPLVRLVKRADEVLPDRELAARGIDAGKLVFVGKEAWYKAAFATLGFGPDFLDAKLTVDVQASAFWVEFPGKPGPRGLTGAFCLSGGLLCAVVFGLPTYPSVRSA